MAAACRKSSNTATPQSKQRSQVRYGSIADISRNLFASSMFAREMKPGSSRLERVPIGLNRKRAQIPLRGRISAGKPVPTFPENALIQGVNPEAHDRPPAIRVGLDLTSKVGRRETADIHRLIGKTGLHFLGLQCRA